MSVLRDELEVKLSQLVSVEATLDNLLINGSKDFTNVLYIPVKVEKTGKVLTLRCHTLIEDEGINSIDRKKALKRPPAIPIHLVN